MTSASDHLRTFFGKKPAPAPPESEWNRILDREQITQEIAEILTSFDEKCKSLTFKKGIYIYGSPGCGKSQFVHDILTRLGFDIIRYDAGDVRNKSLIDTITCNSISNRNVLQMMHRQHQPIAIVMDEIDEMNNGDKRGITSLIKLIRQKKTKKQKMEQVTLNPIICIGNYYVDKKMKELKKVCHVFELKEPTRAQMGTILASEGIFADPRVLTFVQGDMRKLAFIQHMYRKQPQFLDDPDVLDTIFQIKTYNDDAKTITKTILNRPLSMDDHHQCLNETDRTIVSLLYHENVVDSLWDIRTRQPERTTEVTQFYEEVLENFGFADHIDRVTFQNQIWVFNEMSSLVKTFHNNWRFHRQFSSVPPQKISREPALSLQSSLEIPRDSEVRFTKVLTKYSTEYNNQLFVYNMCQELDMDKKDVYAYFQELRLYMKQLDIADDDADASSVVSSWAKMSPSLHCPQREPQRTTQRGSPVLDKHAILDEIFQDTNLGRLDIKRMYRYLDKNIESSEVVVTTSIPPFPLAGADDDDADNAPLPDDDG